MSRRRVVVKGLGLISPVGTNTADSWRCVRDGISGIRTIDSFDTEGFATRIGGQIKDFDVSPYLSLKHARNADLFIHYGVANMPGAVPRTSTFALTNTTLGYVESMARLGIAEAVRQDPVLALGANVWDGAIVCEGVAESLGLEYTAIGDLL